MLLCWLPDELTHTFFFLESAHEIAEEAILTQNSSCPIIDDQVLGRWLVWRHRHVSSLRVFTETSTLLLGSFYFSPEGAYVPAKKKTALSNERRDINEAQELSKSNTKAPQPSNSQWF